MDAARKKLRAITHHVDATVSRNGDNRVLRPEIDTCVFKMLSASCHMYIQAGGAKREGKRREGVGQRLTHDAHFAKMALQTENAPKGSKLEEKQTKSRGSR